MPSFYDDPTVITPGKRDPLDIAIPKPKRQTLEELRGDRKERAKPQQSKPKEPEKYKAIKQEVTSDYQKLIPYLKKVEGNAKSQAVTGSYSNGKFYIYDDVGEPAIGYGHRLTPEEKKRKAYQNGITEEEATRLLLQDIKKAEVFAERHFGKKGWAAMDPHRRAIAIEFVYNLGPGTFKQFKSFSKHLRRGNVEGIARKHRRYYSPKPGDPKIPLKPRNEAFMKTFVEPMLTGEIVPYDPREVSQSAEQTEETPER